MMHEDPLDSVKEAIRFLDYASQDLYDSDLQARIRRLYRYFLHPAALFIGLISMSLLALGYYALFRGSGSLSFSLAMLTHFAVIISLVWFRRGGEDRTVFLSDVHRSDEIIMEVGIRDLLQWPQKHPEESIEEGDRSSPLLTSLSSRKAQLLAYIAHQQSLRTKQTEHSNALLFVPSDATQASPTNEDVAATEKNEGEHR